MYNSGIEGLRSLGGQEVHILPIVESFTKYSAMVNDVEKIKYHLDKAICESKNGRPGPSWLDIPLDVQSAIINPKKLQSFVPDNKKPENNMIKTQLTDTFELLKNSERPVIIAGHGIRLAGAEKEFLELVSLAKIPVVVSKLGQDLIDDNNPYYTGFGGTKGTRAGNLAMQNSDLILSIGSRLAIPFIGYEYDLFGRDAKKISVDIDPLEHAKKTIKLDISITCDAKIFIEKLIVLFKENPIKENKVWVKICKIGNPVLMIFLKVYHRNKAQYQVIIYLTS